MHSYSTLSILENNIWQKPDVDIMTNICVILKKVLTKQSIVVGHLFDTAFVHNNNFK